MLCAPHEEAILSRRISHGTWTEHQATYFGEQSPADRDATFTHVDAFGGERWLSLVRKDVSGLRTPTSPTCVISAEGAAGGLQTGSISGVPTAPVLHKGRLIGQIFEDADARYCLLGGVYPSDPSATPGEQAEDVFRIIESALSAAEMDFRHVVRTWFYNDRILDWYADFNRVRTTFFREHGITLLPASTGIGAPNPLGTALVAKVTALLPKSKKLSVRMARSPLQCEASAYGSAFSRAIEVAGPHARTLYVSGTASIEPGGKTVHQGSTELQIRKTMEVVDALLGEAGMDLRDTTRAVAYFRDTEDVALWHEYCRSEALPQLPVIAAGCTICRDDLLFEIELDASKPSGLPVGSEKPDYGFL